MVLLTRLAKQVYRRSSEELLGMHLRLLMALSYVRDHDGGPRRPFIRFFACEQDLSHEQPDTPLPEQVVTGAEPYLIVGAMAGG